MVYDCGEFPTVMDKALRAAGWDGYAGRQADSRVRGKIRGRGIGHYLEVTAPAGNEMGGIRFEPDGAVTIITGTLDYGQGHASPFAQVLSAKLGIPFEKIKLLQGDSDELVAGGGTGGSRSIMQNGGAIIEASDIVIERGKHAAAHFLVVAYTTVNDFGVLVNPMLVEGQAHGGIAQGIGQALTEMVVYDDDGQLLTGSYMDYALPRANDFPELGFESHPVPARTNPLGAKGCGEAGCAGSLPAVMNAVVDALSEFGITHIDMPATPYQIWQAIQASRSTT
jgi:CO/xanthine dehydrogenase Mo-binding subunit